MLLVMAKTEYGYRINCLYAESFNPDSDPTLQLVQVTRCRFLGTYSRVLSAPEGEGGGELCGPLPH